MRPLRSSQSVSGVSLHHLGAVGQRGLRASKSANEGELPVSFYEPDWAVAPKERPSVWAVMGGWLKQESFYRDIATRALSIAVVALVAYVYAVAAGYISTPPGKAVLPVLLMAIYSVVLTPLVFRLVFQGKTSSRWLVILLFIVATAAGVLLWLVPTDDPQWQMVRAISVDIYSYIIIGLTIVLGFGMLRDQRRANAAGTDSAPT